MGVEEILAQVSTLGFPIVAFVGLFYLYDKTLKDVTVTMAKVDSTLGAILEFVSTIDCPRKKGVDDNVS